MRADDKVDRTSPELSDDSPLLLGLSEPRKQLDFDREVLKALYRRLIMLPRKHRGRHKYRDLLAVKHSLERRTQRDLRFAEADIAAKQSVHRGGLLHIRLYLLDAAQLILCFIVVEPLLKLRLPLVIGGECKALCELPLRVQLCQLFSHILDRRFYAVPRLCPFRRVELVELYIFIVLWTYIS